MLKAAAIENCKLRIIDISKPTRLEVDASGSAIGAVLKQKNEQGKWTPCAYYSKKLTPAECKYHVGEKEFLGLVRAIKHWRYYLSGPFEVRTDHRNIVSYMEQSDIQNPRIARWVLFLQDYQVTVKYVPGILNVIADSLSREWVRSMTIFGDFYARLRKAYIADKDIGSALLMDKKDLNKWLADRECYMQDGCIMYQGRLLIPWEANDLKNEVMELVHSRDLVHPGQKESYQCAEI